MRGQFMILIHAVDDAAELDDAILGAWLRLVRYCAGKLNGGRIAACRGWRDRDWLKAVRIDRRRVEEVVEAGMAAWAGDDLVLAAYDAKGDAIYAKQRDEGHRRAAARWGKVSSADSNPGDQGRSPTPETGQETDPVTDGGDQHRSPNGQGRALHGSETSDGGGGGSTRAAAPLPRSSTGWEDEAHALLADHALATDPKSLREWRGHLREVACVRGIAEARAYLRWATDVAKAKGLRLRYARQFEILGQEWNNGEREKELLRRRERSTPPPEADQPPASEAQG